MRLYVLVICIALTGLGLLALRNEKHRLAGLCVQHRQEIAKVRKEIWQVQPAVTQEIARQYGQVISSEGDPLLQPIPILPQREPQPLDETRYH